MLKFCTEVDLIELSATSTYSYIRGGVLSNKSGVHNKKGGVRNNSPHGRHLFVEVAAVAAAAEAAAATAEEKARAPPT
jgi:hypothetical protein